MSGVEELVEPVCSAGAGVVVVVVVEDVRWRQPPHWARVVGISVRRAIEEKAERCMVEKIVDSFKANGRLAHRTDAIEHQ